MTKWKSM